MPSIDARNAFPPRVVLEQPAKPVEQLTDFAKLVVVAAATAYWDDITGPGMGLVKRNEFMIADHGNDPTRRFRTDRPPTRLARGRTCA